jgi:hypothetical protein
MSNNVLPFYFLTIFKLYYEKFNFSHFSSCFYGSM